MHACTRCPKYGATVCLAHCENCEYVDRKNYFTSNIYCTYMIVKG